MKVAITGANGFVGRHLCRHLNSNQFHVVAISRKEFQLPGVDNRIIRDFSQIDLGQKQLMGCISLVHLAGLAHSPKSQIEGYYLTNVDNSLAIATAAANAGVKRFIYMSSIKVNGETTNQQPFCSNDPAAPEDDYAYSKWQAEQALSELCKLRALELIIIRPPLVWGEHSKGNLASLEKAIRYHLPLPFAGLYNRRDMVSQENLASLIQQCLVIPVPTNPVLLVSDGMPLSTTQVINQLASRMHKKAILFKIPDTLISLLERFRIFRRFYNRLFANLEVNIEHTRQVTNWQPTQHTGNNAR